MITYKRLLKFGTKDDHVEVNLTISGPFYSPDDGMYFEWACEQIHPFVSKVYGNDEIWCLYYTLNSIQIFFKIMADSKFHIWMHELIKMSHK
jgi:hypothetical protein